MAQELDEDELIDCWTLVGDDLQLVAGKPARRNSGSLRYRTGYACLDHSVTLR
ncbi:hypothetical protein ACIBG0_39495 [Nocardia sp. NPDC050630]|uniref:hypothetical protein n=1 Tax=Nocardia sp. NPDC050630 TaxID=3364321 RepID=UPI00379FC39F